MGPLVTVLPEDILYNKVKGRTWPEIVPRRSSADRSVDRLLYVDPTTKKRCRGVEEIPFYQRQQRFVLQDCGTIDPESIEEYLHQRRLCGGEEGHSAMTPEQICQEITKSGPAWPWRRRFPDRPKMGSGARASRARKKYVICNADEGDPGAFMNRSVMEGNPHSVLEGLMIAARAIGADETLVYVRTEYPLAVQRMRRAVAGCARRWVSWATMSSGPAGRLRCEVMEGAGAFVCGEETAMIASIEGQRGMPRPKPPFPAQSGLWGKPTIINNVETLAHVGPHHQRRRGDFRKLGTPASPGTKTFALTGHVANTGLVEVPFGTTLREVVFEHRRRHHRPARAT